METSENFADSCFDELLLSKVCCKRDNFKIIFFIDNLFFI